RHLVASKKSAHSYQATPSAVNEIARRITRAGGPLSPAGFVEYAAAAAQPAVGFFGALDARREEKDDAISDTVNRRRSFRPVCLTRLRAIHDRELWRDRR